MSNLNNVVLQGNLVKDPTVHGTDGTVARFTIAVNDGFGERKTTTFVDCVAFGKQVSVIQSNLVKGKQVVVRGRLSQNKWETPEGEKRSKLEVILENFNGFYFTGSGGGKAAEADADTSSPVEPEPVAKGGEKLF